MELTIFSDSVVLTHEQKIVYTMPYADWYKLTGTPMHVEKPEPPKHGRLWEAAKKWREERGSK